MQDNVEAVLAEINLARLAARDQWWTYTGSVRGKPIRVKGYRTWIQRFECWAWTDGGPPDITVTAFKNALRDMLSRAF